MICCDGDRSGVVGGCKLFQKSSSFRTKDRGVLEIVEENLRFCMEEFGGWRVSCCRAICLMRL